MIEGFGLRQSCTTTVRLANADRQRLSDNQFVNTIVVPAEVEVREPASEEDVEHDRPWVVIVWNDPINLMSYVTLVFQKLFGYSLAEATKLMLQVHNEGKAVVSSGNREKSELDVSRLHAHGLWATMQQD
jgi:ATP-dependent Clp protease adaptor protein ClpS